MPDYTVLRMLDMPGEEKDVRWVEVGTTRAKGNSQAIDKISDRAGIYVAVALRNFNPKFTPVTYQEAT